MAAYPTVEAEHEQTAINVFLRELEENLRRAREAHARIMTELGRPTRMVAHDRRYSNLFVPFDRDRSIFGILQDHHYHKVLLAALRYRWRPAEILALWQNEGLPAWRQHEEDAPARSYLPISGFIRDDSNKPREPRGERQARAWAISVVLWTRWGLDRLIPNRERGDNPPIGLAPEDHERVFQERFQKECVPFLTESPWTYLFAEDGPIEVKNKGGIWHFRTHPEYQLTAIALQMARFQKQIRRIPALYKDFSTPVYTRPVFPAALYFHYNSPRAERHFKVLARTMVNAYERSAAERMEFNGEDIYRFYTGSPMPRKQVEDVVIKYAIRTEREEGKPYFNIHPWVNALRFELLRQVYSELFKEVTIEEPVSPFLIEEI